MANRKATFAKRQRETDLKDRAKAKEERRAQKRGDSGPPRGPQIAWEEAVHAVVTDETAVTDMPSLDTGNQNVSHSVPGNDYPPGPPYRR